MAFNLAFIISQNIQLYVTTIQYTPLQTLNKYHMLHIAIELIEIKSPVITIFFILSVYLEFYHKHYHRHMDYEQSSSFHIHYCP